MQAARFVPAGSIRLGIDVPEGIQAAAFKRPDGKKVLLVQNEGRKKNISIEKINLEIPAESVLAIIL
jgi:glucosylceramidase